MSIFGSGGSGTLPLALNVIGGTGGDGQANNGGGINLTTGTGGIAYGIPGGDGGDIIITTGAGGNSGDQDGSGGDIKLTTGAAGTGGGGVGTGGNILLDTSNGTGVRIGSAVAPTAELDVTGNITATGDINATNFIKGARFISSAATSASGTNAVALGTGTTSSGAGSFAGGYNEDTTAGEGIIASGEGSLAAGSVNINAAETDSGRLEALGAGSIALGYVNAIAPGPPRAGVISSVGDGSVAAGYVISDSIEKKYISSEGTGSIAMGYANDVNLVARGDGSVALGYNVQSLAEASVTLGKNLKNYNANSVLVKDLNAVGSLSVVGDSNFLGDLMITGKSFASTHVDHTPGWEGSSQDALEQLLLVETGEDGKIDHSSLPEFTRVKLPYVKAGKENNAGTREIRPMQAMAMTTETVSASTTEIDEATTGRDLGATLTMVIEAIKALDAKSGGKPVATPADNGRMDRLEEENSMLKQELCAKDSSYSWCEEKEEEIPVEGPPIEEEPLTEELPVEKPPLEEPYMEECSVACSSDGECDDSNRNTLDVCNNDGDCDSSCTNLPVVFNAKAIWGNLFGLLS